MLSRWRTWTRGLAARLFRIACIKMLPRPYRIALEQVAGTAGVHRCPPRRIGDALDHRGGLVGVVPQQGPGDVAADAVEVIGIGELDRIEMLQSPGGVNLRQLHQHLALVVVGALFQDARGERMNESPDEGGFLLPG